MPASTRHRIRALAIPPGWTDVWICRSSRGHIQATGRDAKGRKQYVYHPGWHLQRSGEKHDRIERFARQLPAVRRTARQALRLPGLPRQKALATAVLILDRTGIRIGSERYARENGTFGLASIRSRHVTVVGDTIRLAFTAKGSKAHRTTVVDAAIAKAVRAMDELPGYEVLSYRDEESGAVVDVTSGDVNGYIKDVAGDAYSAKDFRTWAATVAAAVALAGNPTEPSLPARRRAINAMLRTVSDLIGNTPAVCRASYVDPRVIASYHAGVTINDVRGDLAGIPSRGLSVQERLVLALLRGAADVSSPTRRERSSTTPATTKG